MVSKRNRPPCYQSWKCQSLREGPSSPTLTAYLNYFERVRKPEGTEHLLASRFFCTSSSQPLCTWRSQTQPDTAARPDFPFPAPTVRWECPPELGSLVNAAPFAQGSRVRGLLAASRCAICRVQFFGFLLRKTALVARKALT